MKSAKQEVFSVFSIIFYSMVFFLFFSAVLTHVWLYLGHLIVAAVCAAILGAMTAVKKERIVMAVSAATCVTGFAAFWCYDYRYPVVRAVYLSGYPILFLLVLILLLGKKKVFKIVQMVMIGLLFVNAVANVLANVSTNEFYTYYGYYIDLDVLFVRIVLLFNSLASLFWGMWVINFMQYGKKTTDDISLKNLKK